MIGWHLLKLNELKVIHRNGFQKFKRSKLNVDKEIYNKARNKFSLVDFQKKTYKKNLAKPKDLWKTLKSLGLSKKFSVVQTNAIEDNKRLKYDLKSVAQTFAKFYSNLAESLLKNLPNSPSKFDINSFHQYYKNIELKDNFNLNLTMENKFCNLLTSQKQQELIKFQGDF